ncbi:hypothetical protein HZA43_02320 [Candidatus Peregrinibacteria bacterium]|nr:hypothetical protein [Candidatus Peregrinibacteria bacterium]
MPPSLADQFSKINELIATANTAELRHAVFERIEGLIRQGIPLPVLAQNLNLPMETIGRGVGVTRVEIADVLRNRFPPLKETPPPTSAPDPTPAPVSLPEVFFSVLPGVAVPPDLSEVRILSGSGEGIKPPCIFPRTKLAIETLRSLDIEPSDTAQCTCLSGTNMPNMMRGAESYHAIAVHTFEKIILVCDEEGNPTYVIHRAGPVERYAAMRKSQLNAALLHNSPMSIV